ncbi:MAG: efflux RND transporter permease subunit [Candidatus Eremiobacteraeota bacterium]|nr:efflux RND transporter permease subunit [Candidatus Eremiobacteraeota bacterium]MBV9736623.1 efflux RND transporter permease subunit [Candidatus Eremiobacteraeota bacterium]
MSKLTALFVHRPTLAVVLIALAVIAAVTAYPGLVQQQFPNVNLPVIQVFANLPGASPDDIRDTVARPIENQIAGAPDLDHIQTTIQQGRATIAVFFSLASDTTQDQVEVQRRVQSAQSQLPTNLKTPTIATYDPSQGTVVELTASSSTLDLYQLSNLVDNSIVLQLAQLSGVSQVQTSGDVTPAIEVEVDPLRLGASGAAMTDVLNAVGTNNVRAPGGIATSHGRETVLDVRGDIQSPSSVGNLSLGSAPASNQNLNPWTFAPRALQVRDVANLSYGYETQRVFAYRNGVRTIVLDVQKISAASEVNVSNAVLAALPDLRRQYPDIALDVVNVQANYTKEQIGSVWRSLIEAIALTAIVMLFFLRSWRNSIVVCVAIPTSLCVTIVAIRLFGFTLDTVSLAAMTLVIGILVDDSTVVLENIERHHQRGEDAQNAAINGRGEIALAALTLTLVDVVVFLPLAFLPGTVGRFLKEFGIVVAVATLASLAISFTITPTFAGRWALFSRWRPWRPVEAFTAWFDRLRHWYVTRALPWGLRNPKIVITISAVSLIIALTLVPLGLVGFEFIPAVDRGEVTLQVRYPVGTSIETTQRGILALEHEIVQMPQVNAETALAGSYQAEFGGFVAQGFIGQVHVYVKVDKHQSSEGWIADILPRARKLLPNTQILAIPATSTTGGTQQPINYVINAPAGTLDTYGPKIYDALARTPGAENPSLSSLPPMPNVDVTFDRNRARALGISVGTAANAVQTAFGGTIATQYTTPYGAQDVQVIYPLQDRYSLRLLEQIPLRSSGGSIVYAGDVARFHSRAADPLITRINRTDVAFVSANVTSGYIQSKVDAAFKHRLGDLNLPPSVFLSPVPNGSQANLNDTVRGIAFSLILSIVLVFLLMTSLYNSFRLPFIIMFSIPVATFGALGSLAITHLTLNLFSMIGTLLLVGLVTKNGILLVDYANHLRDLGHSRLQAIAESAATRFRPIIMTTFAMVAGMAPIALAIEPGSEVRQALGVVVIGGLLSSLALTLVLVPVVYLLLAPKVHEPETAPAPAQVTA